MKKIIFSFRSLYVANNHMQQEQIKTLIVNIFTGVVIVGVFVAGYFVFLKKEKEIVTPKISVARVVEQTASIGIEIDSTVRDLRELSDAVARSKVFFDLPSFGNLENFSVTVPDEEVGRENPFLPTVWKLKMKAMEESIAKNSSTQQNTQPVSVVDSQFDIPFDMYGDFDSGI